MQGPGSVTHLMDSNNGTLPDDTRLLDLAPGTAGDSVTGSSGATSGSPICVNGKVAPRSWSLRRRQAEQTLSAGAWGGEPAQGWQLSAASLSCLVLVSMALGAGGAVLISRRL